MSDQRRKAPSLSLDQLNEIGQHVPDQLDAYRASSLAGMEKVQRAKLVQSRRERARLEVKYGPDHPLVVEADRRMVADHRLLVSTRAEYGRATTAPAERQTDSWLLHGYVRTREGEAVGPATVRLYPDPDGLQTPLAQGTSNSVGYYQLTLAPPAADAGGANAGAAADVAANDAAAGAAAGDAASADAAEADSGLRDGSSQSVRLQRGLRINAVIREQYGREPVYVGAQPQGARLTMSSAELYPAPGLIAYQDIVLEDTGQGAHGCLLRTRYLGNSASRELHDLENERPGCQIEEIRVDHRVYFVNEEQAQELGYDYCAYCYGREQSER